MVLQLSPLYVHWEFGRCCSLSVGCVSVGCGLSIGSTGFYGTKFYSPSGLAKYSCISLIFSLFLIL